MKGALKALLLALITLAASCGYTFAQVDRSSNKQFMGSVMVGTDTTALLTQSSSAWLQIGRDSTNKGLLLPRVGDTSDVTDPVPGLVVFSHADSAFYVYKDHWVPVGSSRDLAAYLKKADSLTAYVTPSQTADSLINYVNVSHTQTVTGAKTFNSSTTFSNKVVLSKTDGVIEKSNDTGRAFLSGGLLNSNVHGGYMYAEGNDYGGDSLGGSVNFVLGNATSPLFKWYGALSAEVMMLTAGGSLGIGTTTPTQKLDVNGNIRGDTLISTSVKSASLVGTDANGRMIPASSSGYVKSVNSLTGSVSLGLQSVTTAGDSTSKNITVSTATDPITIGSGQGVVINLSRSGGWAKGFQVSHNAGVDNTLTRGALFGAVGTDTLLTYSYWLATNDSLTNAYQTNSGMRLYPNGSLYYGTPPANSSAATKFFTLGSDGHTIGTRTASQVLSDIGAASSANVATLSADNTFTGFNYFKDFGLVTNGFIEFGTYTNPTIVIGDDATHNGNIFIENYSSGKKYTLVGSGITADRRDTLPDKSGTFALTSDMPSTSDFVGISGDQTIAGVKTFSSNFRSSGLDLMFFGGMDFTISAGGPQEISFYDLGHTYSFLSSNLTADRNYNMPNASGTLALTSDITTPVWDSASFSGNGSSISFTVTISASVKPTGIFIQPISADAAKADFWVDATQTTATRFVVTAAGTTPPSGTNNVKFYYQLLGSQ